MHPVRSPSDAAIMVAGWVDMQPGALDPAFFEKDNGKYLK